MTCRRDRFPLLALTLHRPWTWAITHGTKRVENRDWEPPQQLVGRYFAIHAGLSYDVEGAAHMMMNAKELKIGEPPGDKDPAFQGGFIVGVVRLAGAVEFSFDPSGDMPPSRRSILGPLTSGQYTLAAASPWTTGPWAWLLEDVTAIEPVPCKGARKLWRVPDDVADLVRQRWKAARAAATAGGAGAAGGAR